MKVLLIGVLVSIGLFLGACRDSGETVNKRPVIKSISFEGIADKDVIVDEPNSTITVQIPAILKGGLKPILQLTEDAKVMRGLTADLELDLTSFCYCNRGSTREELDLLIGNDITTTTYRLVILPPKDALKPQFSNIPITFSRQTKLLSMSLPVENLYNNPSVDNLVFKNINTGISTRIYADGACLNSCKNDAVNQLIFHLTSPIEKDLVPGTYSIMVGTKNGLISFPQLLVVTD